MDSRAWAHEVERAEVEASYWCVEALRRVRPERSFAVEAIAGGSMAFTGRNSPLSRARGLGMAQPVSAIGVQRLEAFFRQHGALRAVVDVCNHAHGSLAHELAAAGFAPAERTCVLGLELEAPTLATARASNPELHVVHATAGDEQAWAQAAARGFEMPTSEAGDELDVGRMLFHAPGASPFWAVLAGQRVATSAMAIHHGLASLFAASTLPEFRGRGAQQALLHARLAYARAEGCARATVAAEPESASERNVQRAGFRAVYERTSWVKKLSSA